MRRVVVTGGSGFLGAHLARALDRRGDELHLLLRATSDDSRLRHPRVGFERHTCDLADADAVTATLRSIRPDLIFHCAAYGAGRGQRDTTQLFSANVWAMRNLLEATRHLEIERLVYTGGSSEYGHHPHALSESTPLRPVTTYGAAKAAATLLAQQAAREPGRSIVILRPFSIYGPLESDTRLIPSAIRAALDGGRLPLTRDAFARDFVFVEDVVEACLLAAEAPGIEGETFNVGTGVETSNHAVVETLERVVGRRIEVETGAYEPHPSDTHRWCADPRKTQALLGWRAPTDLEAGLRRTVAATEDRRRAERRAS